MFQTPTEPTTPLFSVLPSPSAGQDAVQLAVPVDWAQGRTCFGGLTAGAAVRVMSALVPSDRPLRSVAVHFVGPLAAGGEPAQVRGKVLRAGRSITQVSAEVRSASGELAITAHAAFGAARDSALVVPAPEAPDLPVPDSLQPMPYLPGLVPAFTQHVDYRWTTENYPFMGGSEAAISGWCRMADRSARVDAAVIMLLLDAWPGAVLSLAKGPTAASSVTWLANFVEPLPEDGFDPDTWFRYVQHDRVSVGGHADAECDLWDADGRLVARSRQLLAVYG